MILNSFHVVLPARTFKVTFCVQLRPLTCPVLEAGAPVGPTRYMSAFNAAPSLRAWDEGRQPAPALTAGGNEVDMDEGAG